MLTLARLLFLVLVKDSPGSLSWERSVGDTAQCTWERSHQSLATVLEHGVVGHVGVIVGPIHIATIPIEMATIVAIDMVMVLVVPMASMITVRHTDPTMQGRLVTVGWQGGLLGGGLRVAWRANKK